jgi:membrane protein DedA with SNARE-associated domain
MEVAAELVAWLETFVRDHGAAAVLVVLLFESFGVPLPGESLLLFASALAAQGEMSTPTLVVAAWIGAVLGDNVGYLIGRLAGRAIIERHGQRMGLTAQRLDRVEAVFARYGPATVAGARFVAVLRQLNGVVAGTLRMDWRRFLVFNAIGAALWVGLWVTIGHTVGAHAHTLLGVARDFWPILAVIAVIAGAAWWWWRRRVSGG